jgi:hypothetical protein
MIASCHELGALTVQYIIVPSIPKVKMFDVKCDVH